MIVGEATVAMRVVAVLLATYLPWTATELDGQQSVHVSTSTEVPTLRPSAEPTLSIGDRPGLAHELFRVAGAVVLRDGRVAVLNSGSHQVRIFSADGAHLVSHGRQGEGPGEFMQPTQLFRGVGDSIVVWDAGIDRASVLVAEGGFVRTIPFEPRPLAPDLVGVSGAGQLLVTGVHLDGAGAEGISRVPQSYFLYASSGLKLDSLGLSPGMAGVVRPAGESVEVLIPLISPTTTYALGGGVIWVETGDRHGVDVLDLDSRERRAIDWDGPDLSLTAEHINAIVEENVRRASNEEARRRMRVSFRNRPTPDTYPATLRVLADVEGNGWVELASEPGHRVSSEWLSLSPAGVLRARLVLPDRMTLLQVDELQALVVEKDDFGLETVRRYRLSDTR